MLVFVCSLPVPMEEHYRKLERMYLAANINTALFPSTTVKISEGKAEIELEISKNYFHALGAMHGSVYFKLLDDAAYFAASSKIPDVFVLTASFNIKFIRPVSMGRLRAQGKMISTAHGRYLSESTLYNADGEKIAFGSGEFVKSKTQLSKDIGYF